MKKFLLAMAVGTLVGMTPMVVSAKSTIYVVNSYDPATFSWTKEIDDGILKGLDMVGLQQGKDFEILTDNLDALVKSSEVQMSAEGKRILADIKVKKPDLIVTTDDDALKFVGLQVDNIPVVFNGVNDIQSYVGQNKIDSIEKPGHNITGVYQTTYFSQSLDLLKKASPAAKTFAVLTDDSTTGNMLYKAFMQIKDTSLPLQYTESLKTGSFTQWKSKVVEWQTKVDAIFVLSPNSMVDENGKNVGSKETMAWMAANSKLPDTCPWEFLVSFGGLLSAADSGTEQGVHTAILIDQILKGEKPGTLPIVTPPAGVPVLNAKRAEALGLTLSPDFVEVFVTAGTIIE